MCGRYTVSTPGDELWESFDLHGEQLPLIPRFNVAPTQPVPIIRTQNKLEQIRWGLKVPNPKAGGFNVRVESLGAPFYRDSIRQRRCLIIADGFYEWKLLVEAKQPYFVKRRDGKPFAFAGIWDQALLKNGEVVDACAILTTTARGAISEVHHRMPVVLAPHAYANWLDPASSFRDLLDPDAGPVEVYAVSARVNLVKNDDPLLVDPLLPANWDAC